MFKIVVRSHARSQTILDQTLALLRQQQDLDLSRSLYLALHREDVPDYERVLKDYPHAGLIIGNERGGHSRTNDACDYFPEGEPLLFMDDDGSPSVEWPGPPVTTPKRPWTNLSRYASDPERSCNGCPACGKHTAGPPTSHLNRMNPPSTRPDTNPRPSVRTPPP